MTEFYTRINEAFRNIASKSLSAILFFTLMQLVGCDKASDPVKSKSFAKQIREFKFDNLGVKGVVNESTHTISVNVPLGTNLTSLVPTIIINGQTVNPSSGTEQNFNNQIAYTVTAEDGSQQSYLVSVSYRNINWVASSGTYGLINALAVSGTTVFAGGTEGVFISTNNGLFWKKVTDSTIKNVISLAIKGSKIFAGTNAGYFVSDDNGKSWGERNSSCSFFSIVVNNDKLFAGTNCSCGVLASVDDGINWTCQGIEFVPVFSFAVSGSTFFAGAYQKGVLYSTDNANANSWMPPYNTDFEFMSVHAIVVTGDNVLAGTTSNGLYISTNNGASWSQHPQFTNQSISSFVTRGEITLMISNYDAYISKNKGLNWVSAGLIGESLYSLASNETNIFVGTVGGKVFVGQL